MRVNINLIKKLKTEKGYKSNHDLANKAGISKSQVDRMLYSYNMPKADILCKLAYELDCWMEDLLIAEEGDYAG